MEKGLLERGEEGEGVRAFLAVTVPEVVRAHLATVQEQMHVPKGVKWVEPENFHFTIRFLGTASLSALSLLEGYLSPELAAQAPFTVTLGEVGAYPNKRRPQVVWVGVTEGNRELEKIACIVEDAVVAGGFPAEKRSFSAHLTLGRVRAERPPMELIRALESGCPSMMGVQVPVTEVVLMRSDLGRQGPTYTRLATFTLQGSAADPSWGANGR